MNANIGQRLRAVRKYLTDEEVFMANYTDGLADLHLPTYLDYFKQQNKIASFLSVRPSQSFHLVNMRADGLVTSMEGIDKASIAIPNEIRNQTYICSLGKSKKRF